MKLLSYSLLALGSSTLSYAAPKQHAVDTGYAIYIGNNTLPNTLSFLGVPYAQPPTGNLRWRNPVPLNTIQLKQNKKTVDATKYPAFCIQGTTGGGDAGGAGSEDCLKVNVYTPLGATKGSKFPVLVYIHGGGYIYGNPANWPFDHWVAQSPNVIIVSVYYRLSSFGFLAHPSFVTTPSLGDLNVGLADQTLALQWVQQHIAAFGGDPGKVTINGESAGGSSVELHMVSTGPTGLFRGAIGQSVYRTPVPMPTDQVELFGMYSSLAGCPAGSGGVVQQMACLRGASVSALARAQDAQKNIPYNVFHPVVDGKVITDYPTRLLSQGKFQHVNAIMGATSNETLAGGSTPLSALQSYFPLITQSDVSQITALYPLNDFPSSASQMEEMTGDHSVRCGREIINNAVVKSGKKAWGYRYNTAVPGAAEVYHASENWMLFEGTSTGFNGTTTFSPQSPTELAFASEIFAYWLSFVRSGDPNTYKLARSPTWTQWGEGRMVLQENKGSVSASASFVEKEESVWVQRCELAVSLVEHEQA